MIEAEFVFGRLETVLDGPAIAFHRHQFFHGHAFGAPSGKEGKIAIGDVAANEKTPRPLAAVLRTAGVLSQELNT